jgi:hypothetical protein
VPQDDVAHTRDSGHDEERTVDALHGWRTLSPYYQALGENPLREGVPWDGWAVLAGLTGLLLAVAAAAFERRDIRQ